MTANIKKQLREIETQILEKEMNTLGIDPKAQYVIRLTPEEALELRKERLECEEYIEKYGDPQQVLEELVNSREELRRYGILFTFLCQQMIKELPSAREIYYGFLAKTILSVLEEMPKDEAYDMMTQWIKTDEEPQQINEKRDELLKKTFKTWEEYSAEHGEDDEEEEEEEDLPWTFEELMGYSVPDLREILLDTYILDEGTKEEIVSKILEGQTKKEGQS